MKSNSVFAEKLTMRLEEALEQVTKALVPKTLSPIQLEIFCKSWDRQPYHKIARELNHEYSYIKDVGAELWQLLTQALGVQVTKLNLQEVLTQYVQQDQINHRATRLVDWSEAINVSQFCGRQAQLETLERWVIEDRCQLVAVTGIGGIGKTMLVTQFAQQWAETDQFESVIWRSLRQAPPLIDFLTELMQTMKPDRLPPNQLDAMMRQLLKQLCSSRCLLILDNAEAILLSRTLVGTYRPGYEDYGLLFQQLGGGQHQSSILLTSREIPAEVAIQAGVTAPTRLLRLGPLSVAEGEAILTAKGLPLMQHTQMQQLIERYQGNPLALNIVATPLKDLFNSNINAFLAQETLLFKDIRDLLTQQFDRLSELEQQVMYWLAINREAVTATQLQADLMSSVASMELRDALLSLDYRSLIETLKTNFEVSYTQQPVVMEYVTDRLINQVCQEVEQAQIAYLRSCALLKVQAKDYVREMQLRLIVQPILVKLLELQGGRENLKTLLLQLLAVQQHQAPLQPGYFAGNIINLLRQLEVDLSHLDFSNLVIRQADLQLINLQGTNFSRTDLSQSRFTQLLGEIMCSVLSPDAKYIAASYADGEIGVWRIEDGQQLMTFRGLVSCALSIAFSPDGETLIVGNQDRIVKLLHLPSQTVRGELSGHTGGVWEVAVDPQGQQIASGGEDATLKIWDSQTGACLKTLLGHCGWISALAFDPTQSSRLASGSSDRTIRLWDIETEQTLQIFEGHTQGVISVVFSPDGQTIASCSPDQTLRLWDVQTGKALAAWQGHEAAIWAIAFSSDGRTLASGSDDQTIKLWDVETQQCYRILQGDAGGIRSIAFSPDRHTLASAAFNQTIRLWDVQTGRSLKTWHGYSKVVNCVEFHPDGQCLASGHGDKVLRLWDVQTGHCFRQLQGHRNRISSIAFTPDGQFLASGSFDQTIRLWNVQSGSFLRAFHANCWINSVAFSLDGTMLASSGIDRVVRLWNVQTGQCLRVIEPAVNWVPAIAFSPNGSALASANEDGTIKLWDAQNAQHLMTLEGHTRQAFSIAFDPIAPRIASGSDDHTIKLWDLQTGQCLQTLQGHQQAVHSLSFHPQGHLLASGSFDQTLKLWDVSQGILLNTLQGHTSPIHSITFDLGGHLLASSSEDGTIRLWDSDTGDCLRILTVDRPYEGMNLSSATGLTDAQREMLRRLGAIERWVVIRK